VAVTACPTGVAHTFMAAEAIETEAKKRGWWVKVETRGSVGAGNAITPEEVAQADLVIVAADIEVDLAKFRQTDVSHHHRSGAEENRAGAG
jgi:PTS system fructose-specific IIC component